MSGLPTPPMEDHKSYQSRKLSKPSKLANRTSKRSNSSHEQTSVVIDGRHKRVWKACERCRMKKTKVRVAVFPIWISLTSCVQCDGESPCKRCKDDGLVCTAGSRKKTEFKQLPRGYVLLRLKYFTVNFLNTSILDMPRSWRTLSTLSLLLFKNFILWSATTRRGIWGNLR
jgi:hypothetical protein